eukprot:RCo017141
MIDTQRTTGFYVRADQIDERLIATLTHHLRPHGRQPPVLTERTEDVRRGAHRRLQAIQFTITPGFRAAFGHSDRQIAVDADQHAGIARALLALLQLTLRQPLQPGIEAYFVGMFFAERRQRRTVPLLIVRRPGRPAPGVGILLFQPDMQRIVGGLLLQTLALLFAELFEFAHPRNIERQRGKVLIGQFQSGQLQCRHLRIIDIVAVTDGLQLLPGFCALPPELRGGAELKVRQFVHGNVDDVQPAAGRGAVRAGAVRTGRIKRMQRVETDKISTLCGQLGDHLFQIGEITDTPVFLGTQRVQLHTGAPGFLALLDRVRLITAARGDDHPAFGNHFASLQQAEFVIAKRQIFRQCQKTVGYHTAQRLAAFRLQAPVAGVGDTILQQDAE